MARRNALDTLHSWAAEDVDRGEAGPASPAGGAAVSGDFTFNKAPESIQYGLGAIAATVWGKMSRYAQRASRVCTTSERRLAHELGLSRNTLRAAITDLERAGWVRNLTPDAHRKTHHYQVADVGAWETAWRQTLLQKAREKLGNPDAFRERKWQTMSLVPNLTDALSAALTGAETEPDGARPGAETEPALVQNLNPKRVLESTCSERSTAAASKSDAAVPTIHAGKQRVNISTLQGGSSPLPTETAGLESPPDDYLRKAAEAFRAGLARRETR